MNLYSIFGTDENIGIDFGIIQSFEEKGFEYLENILNKINYEPTTQLNNEVQQILNTYIYMYINESNTQSYIEYFKINPSNKLWKYYHNNFDNYNILYELCKDNKDNYNEIFKDINNSNKLPLIINNWIKDDLIQTYSGIEYQNKSFMMIFNYIIFNNETINNMLELFKHIYECTKIDKMNLYKLFFKILNSNIYYTHMNITYETLHKCSKVNFITSILFICLNIFNNEIDYDNINNTNKLRNEFKIYDDDNINTILYYLINYCIYVCFVPLYKIQKSFELKLKQAHGMRMFGLTYSSGQDIIKIQNELNIINELIVHPKINNIIIELYENMTNIIDKKSITILNDEILNSIYYYFDNMIYELNTTIFNKSIYSFFEYIINGTYTNNPHIRFQYTTLLLLMERSTDDLSNNSFTNIMKYFNEVDYNNWTSVDISIKHTISLIDTLLKYNIICNYSYNIKNELERTFIFKICSTGISSINEIEGTLNKINELLKEQNINITNLNKNNRIYKSIIQSASKYIIPYIIENHVLVKLMDYINSIKNMPQEILNEIISYYTNGIKITNNIHYKKIKEQYNKIHTNINQTFINLLIKIFENNQDNEQIKEQLYNIYNIKYPELMNLSKEIENIPYLYEIIKTYQTDNSIDIEYTDDFMDPILCIKITDPIMIPEVKSIFDRSSIITHLYTSKTNPFTRKPLTEDDVNKYNELDEIKKQINEFKEKMIEFETNYNK
jgi:hypothetical protein